MLTEPASLLRTPTNPAPRRTRPRPDHRRASAGLRSGRTPDGSRARPAALTPRRAKLLRHVEEPEPVVDGRVRAGARPQQRGPRWPVGRRLAPTRFGISSNVLRILVTMMKLSNGP
jgi:hypothetical protein